MTDIVERLRLDAEPTESDMEEAATEIERLRDALRKIAYLESPQVRGKPQRRTVEEIARAALKEDKPFEDRWDNA